MNVISQNILYNALIVQANCTDQTARLYNILYNAFPILT